MDVRLAPEQRALRDSVVAIVERLGPKAVGQLDDPERAAKLDVAVASSGWRELRCGEAADQPLASGVEAALVAEQLARGLADTPFIGPVLASELRRLTGTAEATEPETFCTTERLDSIGDAIAVDAAGASHGLTVNARRLIATGLQAPAVAVDLTRPSATTAPPADPLDSGPVTDVTLMRWTALGLALTSADLVGSMEGVARLTLEYAKERRQYGTPVGSFQAVQHLLADAFVLIDGARSVVLHAAWAVDALDPSDAMAASAVAKAYCSRAARTVTETAIQVHGGIGNTWECLAHVYLRRSLLSTDLLGGLESSLRRVRTHHGLGGSDGLR